MKLIASSASVSCSSTAAQSLAASADGSGNFLGCRIVVRCVSGQWTGGTGTLTITPSGGSAAVLDAARNFPALDAGRAWIFDYVAENRPVLAGTLTVTLARASRYETVTTTDADGNTVVTQGSEITPVDGVLEVQLWGIPVA